MKSRTAVSSPAASELHIPGRNGAETRFRGGDATAAVSGRPGGREEDRERERPERGYSGLFGHFGKLLL